MAGNTLGPRGKFGYVSDTGRNISITTDLNIGEAPGNGLTAPAADSVPRLTGMKPRGVHVEGNVAAAGEPARIVRKFIPCNLGSALFDSDAPQTVTIDGATFRTTGRRGEVQRFI